MKLQLGPVAIDFSFSGIGEKLKFEINASKVMSPGITFDLHVSYWEGSENPLSVGLSFKTEGKMPIELSRNDSGE